VLLTDSDAICLDTRNEADCNWLCLVPTARSTSEQNCMVIQIGTDIHYLTTRAIQGGEELAVWYAPSYARKMGRPVEPDGISTSKKTLESYLSF